MRLTCRNKSMLPIMPSFFFWETIAARYSDAASSNNATLSTLTRLDVARADSSGIDPSLGTGFRAFDGSLARTAAML